MTAVDVEGELMHAAAERFPTCPRCTVAAGYLTTWHDGDLLDFLASWLIRSCHRRGGHFDLWCRRCYFVVATKAPTPVHA